MTHLLAALNVRRAFAQRPAVGDLPPAVTTTGVAFSLLLLATQVLPQVAAMSLVGIHVQVKRLMAHGQLAGNLLRTPLQLEKYIGLLFHSRRKRAGVAARFRALSSQFTGLLGSISPTASVTMQLATDRGLVASKQYSNLRDVVLGFHKAVNLISFNLAEVFVIHRAT